MLVLFLVYNNQHCPWASPLESVVELAPEHYEICGLVHISNVAATECGKVQSNPNLPYGNLVHQTITYSLVTIGVGVATAAICQYKSLHSPLSWFLEHVLDKMQPSLEANHGLIDCNLPA